MKAIFAFIVGIFLCIRGAEATTPYTLYIAPDGHDSNNGSESSPLRTLQAAHDKLQQRAWARNAEILVKPGIYNQPQAVKWEHRTSGGVVTIRGLGGNRPVFDGGGNANNQWLQIKTPVGKPANIAIKHLRIQNYGLRGIHISGGDRENPAEAISNIVIQDMYFYQIGNRYGDEDEPAYAAIGMGNVTDSRIEDNRFNRIINDNGPGKVHAIYLAHHSSRNIIRNNSFEYVSGDVVRTRDESNDNKTTNNTFKRAGRYAYFSDWYCDKGKKICGELECPSFRNDFRDNILYSGFSGNDLKIVETFNSDQMAGCPSVSAPRIRTSGNERR